MYVSKYYIKTQKWIPAINRLKNIVENYSETVFIEEALHRLVEVYYKIGLEEEAKSAAILLGYNYNSSKWYQNSYRVLNKDYKIPKVEKKNSLADFIKIFRKNNIDILFVGSEYETEFFSKNKNTIEKKTSTIICVSPINTIKIAGDKYLEKASRV